MDRNNQEKVRIYEIGGQNATVARHFVNSADALILVYDVTDFESFATLQKLKADVIFLIALALHKVEVITIFLLRFRLIQ